MLFARAQQTFETQMRSIICLVRSLVEPQRGCKQVFMGSENFGLGLQSTRNDPVGLSLSEPRKIIRKSINGPGTRREVVKKKVFPAPPPCFVVFPNN